MVNRLAVLASDGTVQTAPAGTSGKILGTVVSGAGTTDMARVAVQGFATCEFDGATTAGHYVQASSSVAGQCTDAGASTPASGQVLGLIMTTNGGPGAYSVLLHPQVMGSATAASEQQVSWVGNCDGSGNLTRDGWNRDSSGLTDLYCWFDGFTETTSPYAGYTWQASDNGYAYTRFSLPTTWLPTQPASLTLFLSEANSGDGNNLGWSVETACIGGNWGGTLSGGVSVPFNAAQTGSVASTGNLNKHAASLSPLTLTGCSPGDVLAVKFRRDNSVSNNSAASLLLVGARLVYTRSL